MPKIIDNVRERLICEARRQLDEHGYSAMTIRSVAAACSVGVGTVYNYFPSKDMLIAAFMLEDWQKCLDDISETLKKTHHPETVLHTIYDQLQQYIASHTSLFTDKSAVRSFASSVNQYHSQLRSQIAENIRPICLENARQPSAWNRCCSCTGIRQQYRTYHQRCT